MEINGWQSGLVKRNPNLSRWHWNPLYVYQQGIVGGSHKKVLPPNSKPTSQYQSTKPAEDGHYIKPIHVPFNPKALAAVEAARGTLLEKRTNEAVSGKIQPPHPPRQENAKQPQTLPFEKPWFKPPAYSASDVDKSAARSVADVHGQVKVPPAPPPAKELKASAKRLTKSAKQ
jgi:hypothetical protein